MYSAKDFPYRMRLATNGAVSFVSLLLTCAVCNFDIIIFLHFLLSGAKGPAAPSGRFERLQL
jgi:hypothetical protein